MDAKKTAAIALVINLTLALAAPPLIEAQSQMLARRHSLNEHQQSHEDPHQAVSGRSLLDRILPKSAGPANASTPATSLGPLTNKTQTTEVKGNSITGKDDDEDDNDDEEQDDDDDDDEGDDDEDEEENEDGDDEEVEVDSSAAATLEKGIKNGEKPQAKMLTDMLGTKIRVDNDRTVVVGKNNGRSLGLLALKAIILGPLIGLTIKAALIRGLLYALLAYGLHLFAPALLTSLGLGTGLVGFARQLQPDYRQMLAPHLANLQGSLPHSFTRLTSQYQQLLGPIVESIRSIPEGHCRYRAVCETSYQLIRNARSMSSSLQRISATVYSNFGSDYSKAWLDGIVQSDCAAKYPQCTSSPFSMVATRLAQALGARGMLAGGGGQLAQLASANQAGQLNQQQVPAADAGDAGATNPTPAGGNSQ